MAPPNVSSGRRGGPGRAADGSAQERAGGLQRQRARLLAAMVEIVSDGGYARTSIGELARRAGVSRGTFYELFHDKEECFLAAFAVHEEQLKQQLCAEQERWPDRALEFVVGELVEFAVQQPRTMEFLFHEALLGGREACRRRDALARFILERVREREDRAAVGLAQITAPRELLLGAALRLLTIRTKREMLHAETLRTELQEWIAGYRAARVAPHWRELSPVTELMRPAAAGKDAGVLRRAVPKGRHGLSAEALRALHRERIAYGTALAIREKGHAGATVSDIVACSGVSRDVFYAEFHDKHEAFDEAAKLVFEQLLAKMASAYYGSTAPWPGRVWEAGEAFVQFLEDHPVLAHFLAVGTSAPNPQVDRVNEYVMAFRVFIDDGFNFDPRSASVPAVASEALVCAVLAIVSYQIREERIHELRGLVPAIVYTVIAPFLGREDAESFIGERVRNALAAG